MFTIQDPIHENICLNLVEQKVIDHKAFQRLRRIKALGFLNMVFPGARHSRFEHSIGACHIAGRLFDSIYEVTKDVAKKTWNSESPYSSLTLEEIENTFTTELKQALRLAALLHDVGHGPFSHASEVIMPARKKLIEENAKCLPEILKALEDRGVEKQADHEDYSLIILNKILTDVGLSKDDVLLVACLKSAKVTPPKSYTPALTKVFSGLIDGEFDSDRMDYLRRDSLFCGVPYGNFDLNRLLEGICLVKSLDGKIEFALMRDCLTALEHFLFSRFQMHVQIYSHRIDASCNKTFESKAKQSGYLLPASVEKYIEIDDENLLIQKELADLEQIIKERRLWKMAFESFSSSNGNEDVVLAKLKEKIPQGMFVMHEADKPIKKATLLDLPVITKDFTGAYSSHKIKAISQLVAHYNASFVVRRLFIDPAAKERVAAVIESMSSVDLEKESGKRKSEADGAIKKAKRPTSA